MKKILLAIGLLFFTFASYSQNYASSVELSIGPGIDDFYDITVGVDMNYGVGVTNYLYLGTGVGVKYFKTKYHNSTIFEESTSSETYKNILIPIYARIKLKLPQTNVSPFLLFDIGYTFDIWNNNITDGVFYEPAAGVDIKLKEKLSLRIAAGLNMQKASYTEEAMFGSMPHVVLKDGYAKTVNIKCGVVF
ncbi:MAG: outer membrane beta-barrel protein [Bacteroidales bacterium]|nr:outer membrane beta-barrel protein [Bacteroidales bacterium]